VSTMPTPPGVALPSTIENYRPNGIGDEPSLEEMLIVCLEWLANVRLQDRERYLDAMPNNVPGIDVMERRRLEIRQEQEG
jgi:hypothetical protein